MTNTPPKHCPRCKGENPNPVAPGSTLCFGCLSGTLARPIREEGERKPKKAPVRSMRARGKIV